MSISNQVADEWSVCQAVARLMRACDDQDWDTVLTCMSPDFRLEAVNMPVRVQGADTFVEWQKGILPEGARAQHILGSNTLVTIDGDEAEASFMSTSWVYPGEDVSRPLTKSGSQNTYHLRRKNGQWKIVSVDIVAMWVEGDTLLPEPVDIGVGSAASAGE
jgi:hypothetical protein